jgi:hypothetical protein
VDTDPLDAVSLTNTEVTKNPLNNSAILSATPQPMTHLDRPNSSYCNQNHPEKPTNINLYNHSRKMSSKNISNDLSRARAMSKQRKTQLQPRAVSSNSSNLGTQNISIQKPKPDQIPSEYNLPGDKSGSELISCSTSQTNHKNPDPNLNNTSSQHNITQGSTSMANLLKASNTNTNLNVEKDDQNGQKSFDLDKQSRFFDCQ